MIHRARCLGLTLLAAACATDITHHARPVALVALEAGGAYELKSEVDLELSSGSLRAPLAAGSHWKAVGTIPEGTVYRPLDQVLQVHTGHSYEAYLVCSGGQILGVYLPVEDSFVEAEEPVAVQLEVSQ